MARSSTSTNSKRSNLTSKTHSASCRAQALTPKERSLSTTERHSSASCVLSVKGQVACTALALPARRAQPSQNTSLWQETDVCEGPPLAIGLIVQSAGSRVGPESASPESFANDKSCFASAQDVSF